LRRIPKAKKKKKKKKKLSALDHGIYQALKPSKLSGSPLIILLPFLIPLLSPSSSFSSYSFSSSSYLLLFPPSSPPLTSLFQNC
jgi:hypothetical protein